MNMPNQIDTQQRFPRFKTWAHKRQIAVHVFQHNMYYYYVADNNIGLQGPFVNLKLTIAHIEYKHKNNRLFYLKSDNNSPINIVPISYCDAGLLGYIGMFNKPNVS